VQVNADPIAQWLCHDLNLLTAERVRHRRHRAYPALSYAISLGLAHPNIADEFGPKSCIAAKAVRGPTVIGFRVTGIRKATARTRSRMFSG
jgi:hypothetical protein